MSGPEAQRTPQKRFTEPSLKPEKERQESLRPRFQLLEQELESQKNKCLRVSSNQMYHKEHSDSKQENNRDRAMHSLKNKRLWKKIMMNHNPLPNTSNSLELAKDLSKNILYKETYLREVFTTLHPGQKTTDVLSQDW